jgi:hypothetical protein
MHSTRIVHRSGGTLINCSDTLENVDYSQDLDHAVLTVLDIHTWLGSGPGYSLGSRPRILEGLGARGPHWQLEV